MHACLALVEEWIIGEMCTIAIDVVLAVCGRVLRVCVCVCVCVCVVCVVCVCVCPCV